MPLPQKNNQKISLDEASKLTAAYRSTLQKPDDVLGGLVWKDELQKLLEQPGCVAMRYYYALKDEEPVLVLVGVDGNGNDITGSGSVILEWIDRCPPYCPAPNSLNS